MCDALKAEEHQVESPESFRDRLLQVQEDFPEHLGVLLGEVHEKRDPCCSGYIGDDILPSYMGITIKHYKDPY